MELVREVIKSFWNDRPGHFQLTPSLAVCDWSGRPASFEQIYVNKVAKVICSDCKKGVTGDGEFSDLYHRNSSDHLGPTRSKLHDEGRTKDARDLYLYEDKRKPKPRKAQAA